MFSLGKRWIHFMLQRGLRQRQPSRKLTASKLVTLNFSCCGERNRCASLFQNSCRLAESPCASKAVACKLVNGAIITRKASHELSRVMQFGPFSPLSQLSPLSPFGPFNLFSPFGPYRAISRVRSQSYGPFSLHIATTNQSFILCHDKLAKDPAQSPIKVVR